MNKNKSTLYKNMQSITKARMGGKFISTKYFHQKRGKNQINNLSRYLEKLNKGINVTKYIQNLYSKYHNNAKTTTIKPLKPAKQKNT